MLIKLSELKETEPKREHGDIESLKKSIMEIGLLNPLTINQENKLLAGRRRFQAIKELGWEQVECLMLHSENILFDFKVAIEENLRRKPLTDPENAIAISEYDKLKREIEGSADRYSHPKASREDRVGWSQQKTADDLGISHDSVSYAVQIAKAVEEKPELAKLKGTQILREIRIEKQIEKIKADLIKEKSYHGDLLHGDFFDEIDHVKDQSIDLLFVDPPYMLLSDKWDKFESLEKFMKFTEDWLESVAKKLKRTSRIYICFSQWYQFELYKLLEKHEFFGFNFGQVIIWNYRNNNQHSNRKEYRYTYEPIFYLYGEEAEELNFTPDTYGEMQNNVWTIATPQSNFNEGKYHPAQKPIELLERIIKTGSKIGDLILDPFAGSGTTGIVCEKLNRNYILIEKEKEYIDIAKGRLNGLGI